METWHLKNQIEGVFDKMSLTIAIMMSLLFPPTSPFVFLYFFISGGIEGLIFFYTFMVSSHGFNRNSHSHDNPVFDQFWLAAIILFFVVNFACYKVYRSCMNYDFDKSGKDLNDTSSGSLQKTVMETDEINPKDVNVRAFSGQLVPE